MEKQKICQSKLKKMKYRNNRKMGLKKKDKFKISQTRRICNKTSLNGIQNKIKKTLN